MLAIFGGEPIKKNEFPSWPVTGELDKTLLLETIRSGKWSNGEKRAVGSRNCKGSYGGG